MTAVCPSRRAIAAGDDKGNKARQMWSEDCAIGILVRAKIGMAGD